MKANTIQEVSFEKVGRSRVRCLGSGPFLGEVCSGTGGTKEEAYDAYLTDFSNSSTIMDEPEEPTEWDDEEPYGWDDDDDPWVDEE